MKRILGLAAALFALAPLVSSAVGAAEDQLPNLMPLPAYDLTVGTDQEGARVLQFAVATANRGDYALDLEFEPDGVSTQTAEAHQCVAWATDRLCTARSHAGTFEWHPEHQHHHFQDFALYELRRFRRNGLPDMRPQGLMATSGKVSYCLIDVEKDRPAESPMYEFPHPLYYTCVVGAGFQGISPGWRDVYSKETPGQSFGLDGVGDGVYALVVTSDPEGHLLETNENDNRSVTGFRLSDGTRNVDAVCASEPGTLRCQPL